MKLLRYTATGLCLLSASAFAADDKSAKWNVEKPDMGAPAYQVNIDTTTGTWMSLDVSPDGKTIVFDLLGDLYTLPMAGGEAKSLTSGVAWDIQPRFSPDGKYIAFTSDRSGGDNIWTIELATGELHQVSHETFRLLNNPTWSPDGEYIAARKHFTTSRSLGTGEVWLYAANGTDKQSGQKVVARPGKTFQKELGEPMFAPDGKSIYYSFASTPGNTFIYHEDSNGELFQIRKVDLNDGSISTVAGGPGGAVRPTPSPDGKTLAYVKRVRAVSRLFVMDLDSGEETMIYDDLDQDMQETWAVYGVYPNMDWTPDGKHIVFWNRGKLWRINVANQKLTEIPFRVKDSREVYPSLRFAVDVSPDKFDTKMVRFASRSPNGKKIVFASLGRLYVKQGNTIKALTNTKAGFDYSPVWSHDGNAIYFLRWNDDKLTSLHRISASGGSVSNLPLEKGHYQQLAVDHRGKYLALKKQDGSSLLNPWWGNKAGLYLYDLKKRSAKFVSKTGYEPQFGPDPERLYALNRGETATGRGSQTASTQLISMNHNGNDVRTMAEATYASDIRISPNGNYYAYADGYHMYLTKAMNSGKALALDAGKPAFPRVKLSSVGGTYLHFNTDGSEIAWSTGPEFKSVAVKSAMAADFEPVKTGTNLSQTIKANISSSKVAITGARIITMNDNRDVIENGVVLVNGKRIEKIGDATLGVPAGYTTVDASGKTIMPGLIDIHAHGPYGYGEVIPQQNWDLLAHFALGVTTVHNPSSQASTVFAAAEYQQAGEILGPRIYSTGEIIYGAKSLYFAKVSNYDDALAHVRRLKAQGAISVKNYNQPRREQRQQINAAARAEGLMSVAEGGSLFHLDMSFLTDATTGIEHNVPTLRMYDDVTQYWSQTKAGYTPTLVVTYGGLTSEDYYYQHTNVWEHKLLANFVPPAVLQPRSVRRLKAPDSDFRDDDAAAASKPLLEKGINVNIGAHGQREGLAAHWEMWSFARGGYTPMETLSTATINPARYMGMDKHIGSLEAGKLADLLILDANPLEDIHNTDNIHRIMQNGRLYEAESLSEVVTGDAKLQPFYWQLKPEGAIR